MYTSVHTEKIIHFYLVHRRLPNYREAAAVLGLKSKNSITRLMRSMAQQGLVERTEQGPWIPTLELRTSDIIGELTERPLGLLAMLRIKTDALRDGGIIPSDMLCIQYASQARIGDLVLAKADGKTLIRYYEFRNRKTCLSPRNKKYRRIYPKDLKIIAVVRGLIRVFRK